MPESHSRPNLVRASRRAGPAPTAAKLRVPARSSRRAVRSGCEEVIAAYGLDRVRAALAGTNPGDVLNRDDPDLAVADPPGLGGLEDDVHDRLGIHVVDDHLQADLRDEVDRVLGTAVDLAVPALAAVAGRLADRHPGDPEGLQGLLDLVELVRLDDGGDELHHLAPSRAADAGRPLGAEWPRRPPSGARSYAVSPCSWKSMPSTSASSVILQPIVYLMARPMTAVPTPVHTRVNRAAPVWSPSDFRPPP